MKAYSKDRRKRRTKKARQAKLDNFYTTSLLVHAVFLTFTILIILTLSSLDIRWDELIPTVYESLGIDLHVTVDPFN